MPTKIEDHSLRDDLVDDIVEPSSSFLIDASKVLQNRNYYSTLNKQSDNASSTSANDLRNRLPLLLPRSNTSSFLVSNDERRKEIDHIIKYLYDGKLLTTTNDECPVSDVSEQSSSMFRKGSFTVISNKSTEECKSSAESIDLFSQDDDITLLHRELQEKELDITYLHKEIQELRLENKLLKAKCHSTDYSSITPESDVLRRENDVLQNELRSTRDLLVKSQKQQHQNVLIARSNRVDEVILHQKEALEKRLKLCEKQMSLLTSENDKFKQTSQQTERILGQLRRDNEALQRKVIEANKRNDDLFYQDFHSFRNDLKTLKQRNQDLSQENLRLQQEQQNLARRLPLHEQQQILSLSSLKTLSTDSKNFKIVRSESPDMSEASDSTSYLTTVTIERYNNHPSVTVDELTQHHQTSKYNPLPGQEENHRYHYSSASSKAKHTIVWNEEKLKNNEETLKYALIPYIDVKKYDDNHPISSHLSQPTYPIRRSMAFKESQRPLTNQLEDRPQIRKNMDITRSRRPYAPSSINDIDLDDVIKFSRPGGKISRGSVKYIGLLPGKTDLCLGLELETEESKHDGVFEDKQLFHCKPNKGIFVAFNKVIMAWKDK